MTRVVLDTNIYISAVMFGGLPGSLLDLAPLRAFTLIIFPALLDELDEAPYKIDLLEEKIRNFPLADLAKQVPGRHLPLRNPVPRHRPRHHLPFRPNRHGPKHAPLAFLALSLLPRRLDVQRLDV